MNYNTFVFQCFDLVENMCNYSNATNLSKLIRTDDFITSRCYIHSPAATHIIYIGYNRFFIACFKINDGFVEVHRSKSFTAGGRYLQNYTNNIRVSSTTV